MDKDSFDGRVERLREVNQVIEKLDPAVRADAFSLLEDYVTGATSPKRKVKQHDSSHEQKDDGDPTEFFAKHDHDKPSDNALLLAAYHYNEYGTTSFSLESIRELASDVGVTIPERIDMTFAQAKRDGKALFKRAGTGKFRPTVHGEAFFKKTYDVTKGRKSKPEDAE